MPDGARNGTRMEAEFGADRDTPSALWPSHVDVARQVLALGGLSADELTEWGGGGPSPRAARGGGARATVRRPSHPSDEDSSVRGLHSPDPGALSPGRSRGRTHECLCGA